MKWLPLDLFDNETYDDYNPHEWLSKAKESGKETQLALRAQGFVEEQTGKVRWECVLINEWYDPENEFIGIAEGSGKRMRFKRIN